MGYWDEKEKHRVFSLNRHKLMTDVHNFCHLNGNSFYFDVIYLLSLIWFIGISSFDGDYLLRFWESIESWPALLNENFWIEFEVSNKGIDYILWKQFDSTRKIYSNVLWWSMIRNFHFDLIFVRFKTLRKKNSNCQENTSDWAHCKTRIFSWIQKKCKSKLGCSWIYNEALLIWVSK